VTSLAALAPALAPGNKASAPSRGARNGGAPGSGVTVAATGQESDEVLVERVAAGDERAFTEIVRRHGGRLKALALGFADGVAEADDVVQETFWSLWRNARRWRPGGPPLAAYLTRIALNRAIDAGRRRRVRRFFGLEDAGEVSDPDPAADERLAAGGELAAVVRDIHDLPARQRAAILLVADGERANAEIAEIMGLSVGAVEQLLVRARRTLRTRLAARDSRGESEDYDIR
jgi:RNA polymerase sigma-70 factor, ECF subfamily